MQDAKIPRGTRRLRARGLTITGDARVRAAAGAAMAEAGLEGDSADSPTAAVARLRDGAFVLVLCDDALVRPGGSTDLSDLRAAAPDARFVHLLDGGSATLGEDLRRRILEAVAWMPPVVPAIVAEPVVTAGLLGPCLETAAPMAALLLDQASVIVAVNRVAVTSGCTVGSPLPALTAFPLTTWSLAESQAAHRRLVERACRDAALEPDQAPTRLFALRGTRLPDGGLLMSGCEVADADDELNRAPRMLSPREERLQALESFAAGMAREFAQLVGIVGGCSHLLRSRFPRAGEDPELGAITRPLEQSVRQGTELIARLRAFGEQGAIARDTLDAVDLLRDWSRAVRCFVAGGEIRVEISSELSRAELFGNRKALHEALMQLAANAIDALRASRRQAPLIRMRLVAERLANGGDAVAFAISDNGAGIDEANRERIFDPFFSTKPPGTAKGLGLATVASVARAHGGEVRVWSRVGEGSEFRLLLPQPLEQTPLMNPTLPTPTRLLLVDGDRLVLEVTAHALRSLGCRVVATSNTISAARCAAAGPAEFDAVVIDGGLGPELGAKVAEAARAARIARVIVVGSGADGSERLASQADRVLRKPCSAWDLLEALRGLSDETTPPVKESAP